MTEANGAHHNAVDEPQFMIQRLYVKDVSLEVPNSPSIFLAEWKPELKLDLGTKANDLGENAHEIILTVTATVSIENKVAFLVEVQQAGIFTISNFPQEQIKPLLGSYCPNVLYPYAREVITDLVVKAGFPQLYLSPVNFDALYQEHEAQGNQADA
jgi:preprotein translocase subunit SecB